MQDAGVILALIVAVCTAVAAIAKNISRYKCPRYFDFVTGQLQSEHRSWPNALIIAISNTGIFPCDGVLFQFYARFMMRIYNRANIKFVSQGKDPYAEITKFGKERGIDVSMLTNGGVDDGKWLWSKRPDAYESINEFFMRRYKAYNFGERDIVSPVTAVVKRYASIGDMSCIVKGVRYTLENCGIPQAQNYGNHPCFYFYLSPADYHCFHSPVEGVVEDIFDYTEVPHYSGSVKLDCIGARPSVLIHNRRFITVLRQGSCRIALVIIGGFLVDSIRIDPLIQKNASVKKGQYIGAFALGGSAILMLTSEPIDMDASLADAVKAPHPVKIPVGHNFADLTKT